jgi:hypothetical protein
MTGGPRENSPAASFLLGQVARIRSMRLELFGVSLGAESALRYVLLHLLRPGSFR